MNKLERVKLKQLSHEMNVLDRTELAKIVGGSYTGSDGNTWFTTSEHDSMIAEDAWTGGLVQDLGHVGPDFTVQASDTGVSDNNGYQGVSSLTLSNYGADAIKQYESLKLEPYDDNGTAEGGNMTIGYGHLITEGDNYNNGITQSGAESLFNNDVQTAVSAIQNLVTADLTQNQFDALVSYVFNTGSLDGTQLLEKLNNGDYAGACEEMDINTSGGVYMQGLENRRQSERNIWTEGYN